ncbi:MAG TPA: hypothetical protein VFC44_02020 [Candidatus Saccharimonadales bacterium]|nr:hypothetical protein [Candidatus Saccharimonadales bacterium]
MKLKLRQICHSHLRSWFCLAVWLALGTRETLAGPPFLTDDPDPVEYQHWELYLATEDFKTGRDWSGTAPHLELNYGVVTNVQLHLIAPLAYDAPPIGSAHYGYGDTELGAKFRFLQETGSLPQAGIFPLLEVPTGNAANNLGNGSLQAFLPLWLQKSWGSWTAYGGGGYGINSGPGNQDWQFVGAVLQKQIFTNALVGLEIYHRTAQLNGASNVPNAGTASGRGDTAFNLGAVIDFSEERHLLFSAGRSFHGSTGFQCYLAYQFTFDNSLFKSHNGQEK